ncbi:hypothetical protein GQ457_16G008190 [Hibiscus cannabinus]
MIRTNNDLSPAWSWQQDKAFEQALVMFSDDRSPYRWEKIAAQVPGKTAAEVKKHYEDLEHDVLEIESGRVELPNYEDELEAGSWVNESGGSQVLVGSKGKEKESERRKGVPWTEEEHRLFLIGLQKYGKGDWRSISRNAVVSRTPTQVASHAQKYFLRLNSVNKKEKKRSSIHDLTMGEDEQQQPMIFNEQGRPFVNNHATKCAVTGNAGAVARRVLEKLWEETEVKPVRQVSSYGRNLSFVYLLDFPYLFMFPGIVCLQVERGDRIELLVDEAATMKGGAFHFKKLSKRLHQALWMENSKLYMHPPAPRGWITLNSDAFVSGSGHGFVGGVFRNHLGDWLLGFHNYIGISNPLTAELWGIFIRLQLAWTKGFECVLVQYDKIQAVKLINDEPRVGSQHRLVRAMYHLCATMRNHAWCSNFVTINEVNNEIIKYKNHEEKESNVEYQWAMALVGSWEERKQNQRRALPRSCL